MDIEFEATFAGIDVDKIREKLRDANATLTKPETLMRRVVFRPPCHIEGGWLRVRDEGNRITMSIKQVLGTEIDQQRETELVIDDFDSGVKFLESIGAEKKSYQETKRESWELEGAEIEIDTWPGLNPFVEIEAGSEKEVKRIAEALGFDYSQAIFGAADLIYDMELGIPPDVINNRTPKITFQNPPKKFRG